MKSSANVCFWSHLLFQATYQGVNVSFKVHRCVLFSRCPWFAFKDLSKPLEISIPPRAFRALLAYLYSETPPADINDCLHVLGHYANAGIDSIELAKAVVMNLTPVNCFEAYELSSSLGLRGISRAVLDVIEDTFPNNTRKYVEQTQRQINDLKKLVHDLGKRVEHLEVQGNSVSDDDRD